MVKASSVGISFPQSQAVRAAARIDTGLAIGLATLSGCLWFLACPPFDLSILAWVAMVPVMFVLDRAPSRKSAILLCWWSGTVMHGGGFYWLILLLRRFADFPFPLAFLFYALISAYQGTVFLLFGWAIRTLRERTILPMVLIAPVCMVTFELLVPFLFPCPLAISQAWHPLVIQIADLTGPFGVTFLLFAANGALYDLLTRRGQRLRPALAGAALLLGALIYGGVRIGQIDREVMSAPKLRVGIVQGNVAYNLKGVRHPDQAQRQLVKLQHRTGELEAEGAQLVVWSESSYPYYLPAELLNDYPAGNAGRIRRGFTVPVVIGALSRSSGETQARNSAFLLNSAGRVTGRYDKMQLLAFGERVPAVEYFPWLRKWIPRDFGTLLPGNAVAALPFTGPDGRMWRLGPDICYEDILPEYVRRIGALHPDLLVNLTNDTWFGAKAEPWEHMALAVFGSVELRTSLVRAVNSGVSSFIDPVGRVLAETYPVDPYVQTVEAMGALGTVPLLEGGHTVYEATGNLFAYLCVATTILLLWFSRGPLKTRDGPRR